jgi:S1-C subfamily serine protease
MQNSLTSLSDELAGVVERAGASVVAVYGGGRMPSSGVHWSPGLIVTAEHSLRRDEEIRVGLADGRTIAAELAGRDPGTDLAVLKIDGGALAVLPSTRQSGAKTGNIVLAIGRHRDIGVCAAMGIVSVVGPGYQTWRGGRLDSFLRLDLELYPGCSGALVVDSSGQAVGIASSIHSRIAPVAIPAATVDRVAAELAKRGYVARGYLGVGMQPVALPDGAGLIVVSVEKSSPAAKAGFVIGDILLALGGKTVRDTRDVQTFLAGDQIGKTVAASILRGGERKEIALTVGEHGK